MIEAQPRIVHVLASLGCEVDVRIKRGAPSGQEPRLDLCILVQAGLADLLFCNCVLLESLSQRIFLGACSVALVEELGAGQRSAGDCVIEGLGLRSGLRWGSQGSAGFCWRVGGGKKLHFLGNCTAEVIEGFAEIRRVVVCLIGVLGAIRWSIRR